MLSTLLVTLVLSSAQETPVQERSFQISYEAALRGIPAGTDEARLWVPLPLETPAQTISNLRVSGTTGNAFFELAPAALARTEANGGTGKISWTIRAVANGSGRSLCVQSRGSAIELSMRFDVTRSEPRTAPGAAASAEELASLTETAAYPLETSLLAAAAPIPGGHDPLRTARALYDLTLERANGVEELSAAFVGLARSRDIPARLVTGFVVPAGREQRLSLEGAESWALVWIDGRGWIPVDLPTASRHPARVDDSFGHVDLNRVAMTIGRGLLLEPRPALGELESFAAPYAEVDGRTWTVEQACARTRID